jgi:hypothetical protein
MREGKLNEDRDRGAQAERLLRDPLLVEAFDVLENEFMQAWRQSAVADTEARERIYNLCQALEGVKGHLKTVVDTGKLAQANLDQHNK